ncbi:SHOCT domain-containing protein [Arthrobacter sp. CAN_A1]
MRSVSGASLSDEISKARALLDAGTISAEEYELIKARTLAQ